MFLSSLWLALRRCSGCRWGLGTSIIIRSKAAYLVPLMKYLGMVPPFRHAPQGSKKGRILAEHGLDVDMGLALMWVLLHCFHLLWRKNTLTTGIGANGQGELLIYQDFGFS